MENAEAREPSHFPSKRAGFVTIHLGLGRPTDIQRAIELAKNSVTITEALSADYPESSDVRRDMSVSLSKLGEAFTAARSYEQALPPLQQSLKIADTLLQLNPRSSVWMRDVSVCHGKLAEFYLDRREPEDIRLAIEHLEKALQSDGALYESNPSSRTTLRDLMGTLHRLSRLYESIQEGDAARRHHVRCSQLARRVLSEGRRIDPEMRIMLLQLSETDIEGAIDGGIPMRLVNELFSDPDMSELLEEVKKDNEFDGPPTSWDPGLKREVIEALIRAGRIKL